MKSERFQPSPEHKSEYSKNGKFIYLNEEESALEPPRGSGPEVMQFLQKERIKWRTDPVFQCVIVDDVDVARVLETKFGCANQTQHVREFLSGQGVRIIGCQTFEGMLVYSRPDDLLYYVDPHDFQASPLPNFGIAYAFEGLGRSPYEGASLEYDSVADATIAFRREARTAKTDWLASVKKRLDRERNSLTRP